MYQSQTLPFSIHMHIGVPVIECSCGNAIIHPTVIDGRSLPVRVTLRKSDLILVQEWELPDAKPFSINIDENVFTVHDSVGNEVCGKISATNSLHSIGVAWYVLEMRVTDPVTGTYHAPYAVLLQSSEAKNRWEAHCEHILGKNVPNTHSAHTPTLHIAARNIMVCDAVGNYTIALASFLRTLGYTVRLYAHDMSPHYAGMVSSVALLPTTAEENDIILYQYSITDDFFCLIAEEKNIRKILYFHNTTPGFWFVPHRPDFADLLDAAHRQYVLFSNFDAVLANSYYSLGQIQQYLRDGTPCLIFPPYFSLDEGIQTVEFPPPLPAAKYKMLWVGRITPHKRPDLALRIFDELVRSGVDASLTFVGGGAL